MTGLYWYVSLALYYSTVVLVLLSWISTETNACVEGRHSIRRVRWVGELFNTGAYSKASCRAVCVCVCIWCVCLCRSASEYRMLHFGGARTDHMCAAVLLSRLSRTETDLHTGNVTHGFGITTKSSQADMQV